MFELKIDTDGAAFCEPIKGGKDQLWEAVEINRILGNIQLDLEDGHTSGIVFDINENRVGEWKR